ncbi:unnamed protein product [Ranitomeya imitator]|uniref:Uncharacterized protein n=1 Tax=Ranitomeya imitator TaxID=111125 RepID=A0ABN9KQT9_9NEOB|nr:unnamed protein product [Ranitomeya imitator]
MLQPTPSSKAHQELLLETDSKSLRSVNGSREEEIAAPRWCRAPRPPVTSATIRKKMPGCSGEESSMNGRRCTRRRRSKLSGGQTAMLAFPETTGSSPSLLPVSGIGCDVDITSIVQQPIGELCHPEGGSILSTLAEQRSSLVAMQSTCSQYHNQCQAMGVVVETSYWIRGRNLSGKGSPTTSVQSYGNYYAMPRICQLKSSIPIY